MKKILLLAILITAGVLVFNNFSRIQELTDTLNQSVCDSPVTYRIYKIDPRFGVSLDEFSRDLEKASLIWHRAQKPLFKYDPNGEVKISLVYDKRTALSGKIGNLGGEIDSRQESLKTEISDYERRVVKFKSKLNLLNSEITSWNERGGAPPEVYERLTNEQNEIKKEAQDLEELAKSLNIKAENFNSQVANLNQTVNEFNVALSQKPEEGLYDANTQDIYIYFSFNNNELVHTIAHELGHALELTHNYNPKSIMYPYTTQSLTLSIEDLTQLSDRCKESYLAEQIKKLLQRQIFPRIASLNFLL